MIFALCLLWACQAEPEPPPDVLIIVVDTLRADRVSSYGHTRQTTPQLDALAESGVRFADATTPGSWTWPSHAALFTGEPPWVNGAHFTDDPARTIDLDKNKLAISPMRADLPTFAERFAAAGYRTAALYQNSFLHPVLGLTRGFARSERFKDDIVAQVAAEIGQPGRLLLFVNLTAPHSPLAWTPTPWSTAHRAALHPDTAPAWAGPYLTPEGIDLARGQGLRGFDLFATGALQPGPEGLALLSDLYDGEVVAADRQVNEIVRAWKAAGRSGVVVVTSDHGEYFGEHGLLEHGRTVWSQLTHVPLLLVAPGRVPAGQVVTMPVQLQDVYGTVLELAGLEHPEWTLMDAIVGTPRAGPILARAWPDIYKRDVGPPYLTGWRQYREGSMALVASDDGARRELFDLSVDPAMAHDLAATRPEEVARLWGLAQGAYPESSAHAASVDLPDEARAVLIEMGYLEPDPPKP